MNRQAPASPPTMSQCASLDALCPSITNRLIIFAIHFSRQSSYCGSRCVLISVTLECYEGAPMPKYLGVKSYTDRMQISISRADITQIIFGHE